jgi:hypothetical protein
MTSPSAPRSTSRDIDRGRHHNVGTDRLGSLGPYIRRSTGLSLFLPGPQPVARPGRNPQRRSNHRVVVQPFGYPNPHAVLPPLGRGCGLSGRVVTRLPSHPTRRRTFTLNKAPTTIRLVAALAYQARTSTTFPCPLQLTRVTARRRRVNVYLHSTGCRLVCPRPFREHEQDSANLGLAIRRAVTDLTSSFTFPPILDFHPRCRGSCKALKARPLLTARLRLPLRGTPNEPR